jgi:hypothetical protein
MVRNIPVVVVVVLLLSVGVGSLCLIIGILGSWLGISGVCPAWMASYTFVMQL